MKKRWGYLGLAVLIGLGLTGCEMPPEDGSRLPRYSYDEMYGYEGWDDWDEGSGWDDWDGWDAGNDWDGGDDDYWNEGDGWNERGDDYYEEGSIGDVMENAFFNFRVEEAFVENSYGSYEPEDGNVLVNVTLWLENTFGEAIPMYNMDFMLHWGEESGEYVYGLSELAGAHSEIMPDEFYLEKGQDATYHLIYEVPKDVEEYSLLYWEEYEDGYVGGVYAVSFSPESRLL